MRVGVVPALRVVDADERRQRRLPAAAPSGGAPVCVAKPARSACRSRIVGFRLLRAFWVISPMRRPLNWRSCLSPSAAPTRCWPSSVTDPVVILAFGRVRPSSASASVDLPDPLSPTIPTTSPLPTDSRDAGDRAAHLAKRLVLDAETGGFEEHASALATQSRLNGVPDTAKPNTVSAMARPGNTEGHHWPRMISEEPLLIIDPHSGAGGRTPAPRKDKPAVARMHQPIVTLICAMIGAWRWAAPAARR